MPGRRGWSLEGAAARSIGAPAAGIDVASEALTARMPGAPDLWAARDAYVDVVIGAQSGQAFAARWIGSADRLGADEPGADGPAFLSLMEAQRWRLAMFASDGWYWEDPARPETASVLRAAARAARLVDGLVPSSLERRLLEDLALFSSPGQRIDGAELYRRALAEVGQPVSG